MTVASLANETDDDRTWALVEDVASEAIRAFAVKTAVDAAALPDEKIWGGVYGNIIEGAIRLLVSELRDHGARETGAEP